MKKKIKDFNLELILQGGLVVFTQEFERYLANKFGKKIDFQREFNNWWKTGQGQRDFTKYMLEYLLTSIPPSST